MRFGVIDAICSSFVRQDGFWRCSVRFAANESATRGMRSFRNSCCSGSSLPGVSYRIEFLSATTNRSWATLTADTVPRSERLAQSAGFSTRHTLIPLTAVKLWDLALVDYQAVIVGYPGCSNRC